MEDTRNDGGGENVEHDRISSLPNEVLSHILSFLSTKEAVHTCVLSKRWRKMWAIVPVLDFNLCEFLMDNLDGTPAEKERKYAARFERFVNGVLNNLESPNLDVVRYSRQFHRGKSLVSMEWLDHVALLMPRVIDINIGGVFPCGLSLPDLVFSCASLQHLVMEFCTTKRPIIKPMSIYLPSLKLLRLTGVELLDDIAQMLFMGCSSLEWLDLSYCDLYFSSISSMKLKKLSIDACDMFQEMQISCPDLFSLLINPGHTDYNHQERVIGISLKDMTSLVNATIKLHGVRYSGDDDDGDDDDDDDDDYYNYHVPVLDLFGGLSNVTNLELQLNCRKFKGQMEKDIFSCRNFNNLKKLRIGISNMSCDIYLIACFLKHSPNLKDLTFTLESLLENQGDRQLEPCQEVPGDVSFQHEYLETVEIKCCGNSEWASELIKILDKYVKKIGNIIVS